MEFQTIPCELCGEPTPYLAEGHCTNCWEVTKRLALFLKSPKGRDYVRQLLLKFGDANGPNRV